MTAAMDSQAWDRRYGEPGLVWSGEANRFVVAETAALSPGRSLDLACGEGRNTIWLAERGWTATGVDFSAVALEKARRLAEARGTSAEWLVADLLEYEPDPSAFELVLVFYLQLPPVPRGSVVRAAARAVAPGGLLLVVAHDSSNIAHGYGGPQNPAVLYTAEDLVADLGGSDLEIERAERVERPVSTPDGVRTALDALVRARRPGHDGRREPGEHR